MTRVVISGQGPTQLCLLFVFAVKQGIVLLCYVLLPALFLFELLIWNELQCRNGGLSCDPDLEAYNKTFDPDLEE